MYKCNIVTIHNLNARHQVLTVKVTSFKCETKYLFFNCLL